LISCTPTSVNHLAVCIAAENFFMSAIGVNPASGSLSNHDDLTAMTTLKLHVKFKRTLSDLFPLSLVATRLFCMQSISFQQGFRKSYTWSYDASLLQPSEPTFDFNMNSNFDLSVPVNSVSMSLADGTRNLTSLNSRDLQSESI
jgi:hypothetical protein